MREREASSASRILEMPKKSEKEFVENWLRSNEEYAASFVEGWLRRHPQQARALNDICGIASRASAMKPFGLGMDEGKLLQRHINAPSIPVRRKKSAIELRRMTRQELFMELLQDVVSPDFHVNNLSHKILVNVLVLTNADRSSLFIVEGTEECPMLVSRLFDVTENSTVEDSLHDEADSIKIPVGVGIAGHTAKTGEIINIPNAYEVKAVKAKSGSKQAI